MVKAWRGEEFVMKMLRGFGRSEGKLLRLEELHVLLQVVRQAVNHLLHERVGLVYPVGVQVGVL
jgi:hypothetical protein